MSETLYRMPTQGLPKGRKGVLAALGLGRRASASVPLHTRVYAIGDIHGCASLLDNMHRAIIADAAGYKGETWLVYLGDYIDRGADSKGVIDRLVNMRQWRVRFIKGNHDAALLNFIKTPETYRVWKDYGAPETLLSYGVKPPLFSSIEVFAEARDKLVERLPKDHLEFFQALELSAEIGDYFFAHAGVRPGVALEAQSEQDLLWIRDEFLQSRQEFGKIVVHGHTPHPVAARFANRISLDTGAYATGRLSCVVLEGTSHRFLHTQEAP